VTVSVFRAVKNPELFEEMEKEGTLVRDGTVRLSRIGKKITRKNGIKQLAFYQSGFKLFKSVLVKSRCF
jgi:hypothetical protein